DRATIVDLNLDKMVNAMDETIAHRLAGAGSFQEMIWQLGDLPGAALPVDRDVFLEYLPPQRPAAAPPAAQPAAQAPPHTEIYLSPLKIAGETIAVGPPENITNNPGYDNQPFFTADGGILFTSIRGPAGTTQTDIYRYDIASKRVMPITQTPES